LLKRGFKDVVGIQVQYQPDPDDDGKKYEARSIIDQGKKGQQENPEDGIIGLSYQGEWVHEGLLDGFVI
jgi:hypothetical protein